MLAKPQTQPRARVAAVIPCYRVERHVAGVIRGLPDDVSLIVAVDDCSPDGSAAAVQRLNDPRVVLVRHETNQGVGGAMVTGYRECLRRGADVVIKVDGDGQMDPAHIPALVAPLLRGEADYSKGNRWHHTESLARMPALRRVGNLGLSFLAKLASGQWNVFDPCNGYTAVRASVLEKVPLDRLAKDYFFEISMLVELGVLGAVTRDVPMPAVYGDEVSSLRIGRVLRTFPARLARSLARRTWTQYFVRDFGPVALFCTSGAGLLAWSGAFGAYTWGHSFATGTAATAGTVMLAAMPFLMGFQLLLQALVMDMAGRPAAALSAADPLDAGTPDGRTGVKLAA